MPESRYLPLFLFFSCQWFKVILFICYFPTVYVNNVTIQPVVTCRFFVFTDVLSWLNSVTWNCDCKRLVFVILFEVPFILPTEILTVIFVVYIVKPEWSKNENFSTIYSIPRFSKMSCTILVLPVRARIKIMEFSFYLCCDITISYYKTIITLSLFCYDFFKFIFEEINIPCKKYLRMPTISLSLVNIFYQDYSHWRPFILCVYVCNDVWRPNFVFNEFNKSTWPSHVNRNKKFVDTFFEMSAVRSTENDR